MSLATEIAGKLNYLNTQDKVAVNATLPYSGYTQVSKKLDNFVFQTSSSFLNKVADKNRYVKFGEKVVDTYGPELITNGDFSNGTTGWITDGNISNGVLNISTAASTSYLTLSSNKTYIIKVSNINCRNLVLKYKTSASSFVTFATITTLGVTEIIISTPTLHLTGYLYLYGTGSVDNISVREVQTAQFTVPNVTEIVAESSGTTTVQVNAGDYVIQSKTSPTDHTATTFRAKQTVPIGTALTNTTYFEDRTQIGVTNQQLAYHAYNTLTNAYEGIKVETLFSDVSKEDLLDNSVWMARNGFSKVSEFLYSRGSYLAVPVGIWQSLNDGAYHPVFNAFGTSKFYLASGLNSAYWYNQTTSDIADTLSECFSPYKPYNTGTVTTPYRYLDDSGKYSGSVASIHIGNPDSKYYDIVYPDQFIDVREYAKVLNPYEVELIRADKEENGVEEIIFTEQKLQTTTGTINTLEVGNGTNYKVGSVLQIWNGVNTPYRRYVVSVSGNVVTLDSPIVKTVVNFIISGGKLPVLSSNTKLSTDLIGNPTNYPQIMKDRLASGVGIAGVNPLLVGQDGTNYSVGGTLNPIYSSKLINVFNALYTDNGTTYVSYAPTVNFIANTFGLVYSAPRILLYSYISKNNPYIQTTPKPVIDVEPKVKASNSHSIYKGALVGNQICGKVQVGNGSNGYESKVLDSAIVEKVHIFKSMNTSWSGINGNWNGTVLYLDVIGNETDAYGGLGYYIYTGSYTATISNITTTKLTLTKANGWLYLGIVGGAIVTTPQHSSIALDNANSPASKWFECLEEGNNGVLAGVYGQEVVYGADTGSFANLSNGTTTDFSNNTVITFHGSIPLNGKIK